MRSVLFLLVFCCQIVKANDWLEYDISNQAQPSERVIEAWVDRLYGVHEFWLIANKEQFRQFLEQKEFSESKINTLLEAITPVDIKKAASLVFSSSFKGVPSDKGGMIQATEELKKTLEVGDIKAIYEHLHRTGYSYLPALVSNNPIAFVERLRAWNLDEKTYRLFLERGVQFGGQFILQSTPEVWKHVPRDIKLNSFEQYTLSVDPLRSGVDLYIVLTPKTNIMEIARALDSGGRAQEIFEYLARIKPTEPGQSLKIPLQEVMLPFIREAVSRFMTQPGPNCLDCAQRTGLARSGPGEYMREKPFKEILKDSYTRLASGETPRIGDIIVYQHSSGDIIHASTYITEHYSFTKNGVSVFNPYLFQPTVKVEMIYARDSEIQKVFYRSNIFMDLPVGRPPKSGDIRLCRTQFAF